MLARRRWHCRNKGVGLANIFLSYAREDRDCAHKLANVMEAAGHDVWWDRRLDGGEEFSAEIEAALGKSDVVLVAWSQESVKSRWVRDEANFGCESGTLVPVSIDGSMPPMGFRQFHTLDLTGWKAAKRDERTSELLRAIDRRLFGKNEGRAPATVLHKPKRPIPPLTRKPAWAIAATILLALLVAGALLLRKAENDSGKPTKPTIALLPFTTVSPDPELRQIASQARDSIAHTFSESGVPLSLMNVPPQGSGGAVDFVISGDISRNGEKVLATIRLDETAHGVTVYSERFEASQQDTRDLPERIGAQMAGNLTWNFPMLLLDRRKPLDPALLADLLQNDFTSDPLQSYQKAKRVVAKAPNLQVTQLALAFDAAFVLIDLPREERDEAVAEARRAADRAIELGPKFGDAYSPWCMLHSETLLAECEDRLRAARKVDPDAPFLNTFLSHLLRSVGRTEESLELARLAHSHDVYVPTKMAWILKGLEFAGEREHAQTLYERGVRWWPEYQPMLFRNRLFGLIDRGDFEAIQQLEHDAGVVNFMPRYQDSNALAAALKSKSIPAGRRACSATDDYFLALRCMVALAILGDQDGAYAIADKLYPRRIGRSQAETERIWLDEPEAASTEFVTSPAAAPMRRDPRFLQLAERVGLLRYWGSGRLPDFCRKRPEPICPQLFNRT